MKQFFLKCLLPHPKQLVDNKVAIIYTEGNSFCLQERCLPVILDNVKEHLRTSCDSFHSQSPTQGEFTRGGESACLSACRQIDHVSFPVWSVTANEIIRLQCLTGHPTGAVQDRGVHQPALFSLESLSSRALYPNRPWSNNRNKTSIVFRALSVSQSSLA